MNIILFIFWIALVLYVLHETDAIPKWAEAFGLKFLKYELYKEKQKIFGDLKYKDFLAANYPNFFVYLFTCQECLSVWCNIAGFSVFHGALGGWAFFGVAAVGSLIAIAGIKFILRKLYE